jgi:hypothetical protein
MQVVKPGFAKYILLNKVKHPNIQLARKPKKRGLISIYLVFKLQKLILKIHLVSKMKLGFGNSIGSRNENRKKESVNRINR